MTLKKGGGAHLNLEIATISELAAEKFGPVILFDKIADYPPGYRGTEFTPVKLIEVESGPFMENVYFDDDVDLLKFPTPIYHEHNGGRYIGTKIPEPDTVGD